MAVAPSPFQRPDPFEETPVVPANGMDVDLPPDPLGRISDSGGAFVVEGPNGEVTVNLDPSDAEAAPGEFDPPEHKANLAEFLASTTLADLGTSLAQAIEEDLKSRTEWEATLANGLKYLGTNIEERTKPFKGASGVFSPVMLTANVRFQATAFGELMPAAGPCKTEVIGAPSDEASARAMRVKTFQNLYLTTLAPEYRPEFRRMLWWVGLDGGAFKKIYQDQILNRPVAPMIRAYDVIVPYGATDLYTTPRITHRFPVTDREFKQGQLNGTYLASIQLTEDDPLTGNQDQVSQATDAAIGARRTKGDIDKSYMFYECHAYLNLKGFEHAEPILALDETGAAQMDESGEPVTDGSTQTGLPLPYRVTLDKATSKVVSVYRNWDEDDDSYQRQNCFVYYPFVPGMGFYGLGYAHLLGNTARAATALERQIIDGATLAMMPSGVRAKGARFADNNVQVQPLEFPEVDTGGQPIGNFIMPFSFKGADPASIALLQEVGKGAEQIASTSDIAVGEGRQDAPVGTTMALLEASTRIETSIVKGLHDALALELRMIAALFGEYLPEGEPYPYAVAGGQGVIMKEDFSGQIDVIPVSDPNIASGIQRLVRSQATYQMAQGNPGDYDMHEVSKMVLLDMGYAEDKIDKILPPKATVVPMDPLSENMAILGQKPVVAGAAQDHAAHIAVHQAVMGLPGGAAHISEHLGWQMRTQVEQTIGHPLPPPGAPLPPDVENQVAVLVAQAMAQIQAQAVAGQPGGPEDPQMKVAQQALQVQALDIQQKIAAAQMDSKTKITIANIQSQDKAADRANRLQIARTKAGAQETVHGITPTFPVQ